MKVIEWLMSGDPAIKRLTSKYLLGEELPYTEDGFIEAYLKLYDINTGLWGGGAYSPKWISTHYTLLELKYMEIRADHPYYHEGLSNVIDWEWRRRKDQDHMLEERVDVCVIAMLVGLSAYGKSEDSRLFEMIDYLLRHQMPDGGWNCSWTKNKGRSKKSSLHTTLSVLEAFKELINNNYAYRIEEIRTMIQSGEAFLIRKNLFRAETDGHIIHEDFTKFHYPMRWKYDAIRALEYFVDVKKPYHKAFDETLKIVEDSIAKGYVAKGIGYTGKTHFKLETTKGGRFNTFRALKILKHYNHDAYNTIISSDFKYV